MNATPTHNPTRSASRWLALFLAGLVFGMGVAAITHAVDLDEHAFGEVCEICALPSADGSALPVSAEHPESDLHHHLVAAATSLPLVARADGSAKPRAPPA